MSDNAIEVRDLRFRFTPKRWIHDGVDFDVWVELIPFRETRRYTKRVLASRAAYAYVYYPDEAEGALLLPERLGK